MKAELVNIPNRGICILISDIDIQKFIEANTHNVSNNGIFSNVEIIANEIRSKRKIGAIKEVRAQTGWGLREAKDYIDKYVSGMLGNNDPEYYNKMADRFIKDHTIQDFILSEEMFV